MRVGTGHWEDPMGCTHRRQNPKCSMLKQTQYSCVYGKGQYT